MEIIAISREKFTSLKTELQQCDIPYRDSGSSISIPKFGEIVSDESVCRGGIPPGIAAYNAILGSKIADGAPFLWTVPEIRMLKIPTPMFVNIDNSYRSERFLSVVDLSKAYFQIYRNMAWRGCRPYRKVRFEIGSAFDHLSDWKEARNAIIGIARSLNEKWVCGSKLKIVKKSPSRFLSPFLWWGVTSVLHEVADCAVYEFGAVYVNTDGYIFDNPIKCAKFTTRLRDVGLGYTEVSGYGDVYGWGSYKVGEKKTGECKRREVAINTISTNADTKKVFNYFADAERKFQ